MIIQLIVKIINRLSDNTITVSCSPNKYVLWGKHILITMGLKISLVISKLNIFTDWCHKESERRWFVVWLTWTFTSLRHIIIWGTHWECLRPAWGVGALAPPSGSAGPLRCSCVPPLQPGFYRGKRKTNVHMSTHTDRRHRAGLSLSYSCTWMLQFSRFIGCVSKGHT